MVGGEVVVGEGTSPCGERFGHTSKANSPAVGFAVSPAHGRTRLA
ncbi:hypothetical protein BRCON_1923 [Candidatus Sumerlaea chitinivorans]|uniref:Uncharacterized protein n=1 Tax=Sumerlaea chitinivorans TaxID=2250252 RepID=A0A2Z4Y674_SUMC1|nr:hypothetical protein BRCON_1923 [Candidatus Sumerlaea chitinivorans]